MLRRGRDTSALRNVHSIGSRGDDAKEDRVRSSARADWSRSAWNGWQASMTYRQKRIGSLSPGSRESQATGACGCSFRRWAIHWLTNVVLPKPAGAERRVSLPSQPVSSRVSRRSRVTREEELPTSLRKPDVSSGDIGDELLSPRCCHSYRSRSGDQSRVAAAAFGIRSSPAGVFQYITQCG